MSYKAVLWDFGGVITESPFKKIEKLEKKLCIPLNSVRKINSINPNSNAWALLERGDITLKEFELLFEKEASNLNLTPLKARDVLSCLYGKVKPEMISTLKIIKKSYRCACITNNIPEIEKFIKPNKNMVLANEALQLFEIVIQSRHEKTRKPEKRIYEITLEKLGLKAEEIIFLDDLGINLKPAKKLGMKTIKVENSYKAIEELRKLLNIKILNS